MTALKVFFKNWTETKYLVGSNPVVDFGSDNLYVLLFSFVVDFCPF